MKSTESLHASVHELHGIVQEHTKQLEIDAEISADWPTSPPLTSGVSTIWREERPEHLRTLIARKLRLRPPVVQRRAALFDSAFLGYLKLKRSNRSPIAGLLIGAYLLLLYWGLGKLSRLRLVIGSKYQLCSMNFRIDTWSE
jgi:hypothetical protein